MKRLIAIFLIVLLLASCSSPMEKTDDKALIISTLFPQYDFARTIGGEEVNLRMLLPAGAEPHHFEPTPKDLATIGEASLFLFTGDIMEPWVKSILETAPPAHVVDVSEGVKLLKTRDDHEEADHAHAELDPHIWTSLANARIMAKNVLEGLIEAFPPHEELFRARWIGLDQELADLDEQYMETLSGLSNKVLLYGGHFAFGYLAERYGLTHRSPYAGYSTDAEPTPANMAELIDALKETSGSTLFFQELIDPRIAESIAKETGAKLVLLHSAHNLSQSEWDEGLTYLEIMRENLKKLKEGLQ